MASLLVLLAALAASCDGTPPPEALAAAESKDPLRQRASDEIDLGWRTYARYCIGCHGENGDGKGPAAKYLFPPPRDFTSGVYKFTTTPSGSLPTDDDLLRTISYGLRGTAMPRFPLLSMAEKRAVIEVLKRFFENWDTYPPSSAVTRHASPYELDPEFPEERQEAIKVGEELYHGKTTCWNCHPVYASPERLQEISAKYGIPAGRENGDEPILKEDLWGVEIPPTDFLKTPAKSVRNLEDLVRVIAAGVGGTAMPTWAESLDAREIWAVTLYVDSLIEAGRKAKAARLHGDTGQ